MQSMKLELYFYQLVEDLILWINYILLKAL